MKVLQFNQFILALALFVFSGQVNANSFNDKEINNRQGSCPGDFDGNGIIDVNDFLLFNGAIGQSCGNCIFDLTGDGLVDTSDFIEFNSLFGSTCTEPNINTCTGDFDGNGIVNVDDFLDFNSAVGAPCDDCVYDLNGDGEVDAADHDIFDAHFGDVCAELVLTSCPGDFDLDGTVGDEDYNALSAAMNQPCEDCIYDLSGDGIVNVNDFLEFNSLYGNTCAELSETTCTGDFNMDGTIDNEDYEAFNLAFDRPCDDCIYDLTGDGEVDVNDFVAFNSVYGLDCIGQVVLYRLDRERPHDVAEITENNELETAQNNGLHNSRIAGEAGIAVYPNPSTGVQMQFIVEELELTQNPVVQLLDISGRMISKSNYNVEQSANKFAVQFTDQLAPGTYLIQLQSGNLMLTEKFMVTK